ncbi:MAG: exopolysaccharide transport family protein, partial [Kovacikia sp.]
MESEQHSQTLSVRGNNGRFQQLPIITSSQSDNSDEGGLNLGEVFATLRRRIPIIAGVTTVVTSAALLKALTSTPTYQGSFQILTKPVTVESQVLSSVPQTLSSKDSQQTTEKSKGVDETTLKLLKSPKLISPIAKELQTRYPDLTYDSLVSSLTVAPVINSEVLDTRYEDKDPEKVKAVLKLLSDAYLNYSLEERLADVRQGIEFVNTQLPQLQKRVEDIQDRLQSFRQQYNLIDPDSAGKQLTDQVSTIEKQQLEAQVQLNESRALYIELANQLSQANSESAVASILSSNARYQELLRQILTVDSDMAKESSLFRENTPNVQVLRDQKQNLLPLLRREGQRVQGEVASKIRELEARSRILAQADSLLKQQVKQLSVVSRQYTDIQQELKIATDNLNQFLTKREALRIDAGQRKTPWQILTAPTDPFPSAANVKQTAILGAVLGLLLGVGVALVLDKFSNVIHSPEGFKEKTKLPILGVIPFNPDIAEVERLVAAKDASGLVQQIRQRLGFEEGSQVQFQAHQYVSSPFLEAFRSLYTNILLLGSDTHIHSLVISSSVPGEGKSTIAIYLAQAAAALGQKVLLVDTDLRIPQLHNRLELANTCGLSHVISLDLDAEQA